MTAVEDELAVIVDVVLRMSARRRAERGGVRTTRPSVACSEKRSTSATEFIGVDSMSGAHRGGTPLITMVAIAILSQARAKL